MNAPYTQGAALSGEEFSHDLRAQIEEWLASAAFDRSPLKRRDNGDGLLLDLEAQLHTPSWSNLAPEVEVPFDRLRKKIEVARKLYRYYLPDLSRPAAPTALSVQAVQRLCGLLLKAALIRRDVRFLNSALKLLDGVLGRDDCEFPHELRLLAGATLDVLVPPVTSSS
jgi:hypothetical protein